VVEHEMISNCSVASHMGKINGMWTSLTELTKYDKWH